MKNLLKVILPLLIMVGILNAEPLSQNGEKNGYSITISTEKSLVVGTNEMFLALEKNDTIVKDAKVKIKVFILKKIVVLTMIMMEIMMKIFGNNNGGLTIPLIF